MPWRPRRRAPVSSVTDFDAPVLRGERRVRVSGLALDGRVGLGGRLELSPGAGRTAPTRPSSRGTASGVGSPSSGPATVTVGGAEAPFDVVGVARAEQLL